MRSEVIIFFSVIRIVLTLKRLYHKYKVWEHLYGQTLPSLRLSSIDFWSLRSHSSIVNDSSHLRRSFSLHVLAYLEVILSLTTDLLTDKLPHFLTHQLWWMGDRPAEVRGLDILLHNQISFARPSCSNHKLTKPFLLSSSLNPLTLLQGTRTKILQKYY